MSIKSRLVVPLLSAMIALPVIAHAKPQEFGVSGSLPTAGTIRGGFLYNDADKGTSQAVQHAHFGINGLSYTTITTEYPWMINPVSFSYAYFIRLGSSQSSNDSVMLFWNPPPANIGYLTVCSQTGCSTGPATITPR